ncbi:MAG: HNH endonuclease [Mycoplasma sp.]
MDKKIKEFIKSLNNNAPLTIFGMEDYTKGYKFPYKPILMIAILSNIDNPKLLFNNDIWLDFSSPIIKTYYDILTNSEVVFEFLKTQKSKELWYQKFDDRIKKSVVSNIFEMPASKLKSTGFWFVDKKNKTIRMEYDFKNDEEAIELRNFLLTESIKTLHKCVPEYKSLSLNEILEYEEYMESKLFSSCSSETIDQEIKTRRYQHIFRKIIINRDQKCKICCLDQPWVLQAAHIKPYSKCSTEIEKYDEHNGILLCRNHHVMFDNGLFTFNDKWQIIISSEIAAPDQDLLIKTFEPCYCETLWKQPNGNEYVKYHNEMIFIK